MNTVVVPKSAGNPKNRRTWPRLWRFALAVGAVGAAAVLRWQLNDLFGSAVTFITFYPTVAVVGMVAGGEAGILATVLSALAADYLFMPGLGMNSSSKLSALGLFLVAGMLMSLMAQRLARARQREWQAVEREKAAEALRQSESQVRALFEHALEAILLTTVDGRTTAANPAACKMFGMTEQELMTVGRAGILDPQDTRYAAASRERQRTGRYYGELGFLRKGGEPFTAEVSSVVLSSEQAFVILRDVTQRKQAEEALRHRAEEVERLLDVVPAAVLFSHDPQCRSITGNRRASQIYEAGEGENLSATAAPVPRRFFTPEGRELAAHELPVQIAAATNREVRDAELHIELNSGRRIILLGNATPLRNERGEVRGGIGAFVDITARKRAEEALRRRAEEVERLLDVLPAAIWIADDPQCLHMTGNRRVRELYQAAPGENLSATSSPVPRKFFSPEGRELLPSELPMQVAAATNEAVRDVELHMALPSGNRLALLGNAVPLRDGSGKVRGCIGAFVDLTDRKRVEEALRRNEALVTQAVRVAGLGIFEHYHDSDLLEYSPLMRKLMSFGDNEKVTIGALLQRVVPEDREALAAAIRQANDPAGDGIFTLEYRVVSPEGRIRWVDVRSQTFFTGQGPQRRPLRSIGAVLDVTERKEFQAGLERLVAERTAKLQEMVSELEHFSYTITHDMRAPLRAMRGYGEVVSELCAKCAQQQQRMFLGRIMTSADRMDALIRDALNYSRAVRQELPLEPVDAAALLRGMLDSYPELQPSKANIRIEGKLPVVLGNEAGLTQCFSNLLGNAVKFVKPGETPEVRIWAEPRDGWTRIWVEDHGIGIPQSMLPRVFDMFSRGHKTYEGTGIGLALVRKVMDRMGGKAGVESVPGNGSRFWLDLRMSA